MEASSTEGRGRIGNRNRGIKTSRVRGKNDICLVLNKSWKEGTCVLDVKLGGVEGEAVGWWRERGGGVAVVGEG